jgi:hypothetical protein
MLGCSSGGILDRKEHGPNPRIMQIRTDELLGVLEDEVAGSGHFYRRLGWEVLTRLERAWGYEGGAAAQG